MRIAFAALAAFVINVCYLFYYGPLRNASPLSVPVDAALIADLTLILISLYLVLEGIRLSRRRTPEPEPKDASRSFVEERDNLRTALEEARQRIGALEAQAKVKQRPQAVDAELAGLVALFQEKGRLVDFLMDDITPYDDAQVGAAARVVHQGCSGLLRECFKLAPVHTGKEGDRIALPADFDARAYRLIGRASGNPPYSGEVLHRGWQAQAVNVPRISSPESIEFPLIVAPAEVEV